jgi:multidrug efflux pump
VVDQDKARALGLTSAQIRHALLASHVSGVAITQYRDGERSIEVVARAQADERAPGGATGCRRAITSTPGAPGTRAAPRKARSRPCSR